MRGALYSLSHTTINALLLAFLAGCASTEMPRYYLLNGLPGETLTHQPCLNLVIGPVKLPEYLNRPQIVTRASTNELILGQFDRWAEPLQDTFSRILAENLGKLLCTKSIYFYPAKTSTQLDFRIEAEVMRMDGILGKEASLEIWWSILNGGEKRVLTSKQSKFREPVATSNYEALVQAQSRLLASFCREIADAIKNVGK